MTVYSREGGPDMSVIRALCFVDFLTSFLRHAPRLCRAHHPLAVVCSRDDGHSACVALKGTVNLKGRNKQTPTWLLSKVLDGHARLEAYQQWMKEIGVDHRE